MSIGIQPSPERLQRLAAELSTIAQDHGPDGIAYGLAERQVLKHWALADGGDTRLIQLGSSDGQEVAAAMRGFDHFCRGNGIALTGDQFTVLLDKHLGA